MVTGIIINNDVSPNLMSMKKKHMIFTYLFFVVALVSNTWDKPISPAIIGVGHYHGLSKPLRDLPALTPEEYEKMEIDAAKPRNEDLREPGR